MADIGRLEFRTVCYADGARRKRLDEKGTVHYPGGGYERNVGTGWDTSEMITKYYRALGRLLAFRKGGTLRWVGTDHLGSTILVADAAFSPVALMRYKPYGESRDPDSALETDAEFTSQTRDESIGLYWYGSRAYDRSSVALCALTPSCRSPATPRRSTATVMRPATHWGTAGVPSLSSGGMGSDVLASVQWSIPAEFAPGGVGIVGMTPFNRSGAPEGICSWDSPGGADAAADAAARRETWERAGSPDYNNPTCDDNGNINGYNSV